jgi:hypothetical protein
MDLLTRLREWLTVPDDDSTQRALLRTYESCRTRSEKAACSRLIAERLEELAVSASTERASNLREEAAEWRYLAAGMAD